MDYHVYLCNTLDGKQYNKNNISAFTNVLKPPLIFQDSNTWEVGLKSCILPFQSYSNTSSNNQIFEIIIIITKQESNGIKTYSHKLSFNHKLFINKKPEKIIKIIIDQMEKISGLKFFSYFVNTQADHITITRLHVSEMSTQGTYSNIRSIAIILDSEGQNMFGLNSQRYFLYSVTNDGRDLSDTILGDKPINFNVTAPPYIALYTDIIQPVKFGSYNLQILDILPFGESKNPERKNNELTYKTVCKNIIEDISIFTHNSSYNPLENHAESVIICLHFRKRIYNNGNK